MILEFGNTIGSHIKSGIGIERNAGTTFFTSFGIDDYHTVGSRATIQSGCRRTFQDIHTLNIIGIQIVDTVATVVVTTVIITTNGS